MIILPNDPLPLETQDAVGVTSVTSDTNVTSITSDMFSATPFKI